MLLGLVGLARCALTRFKEKDKKAPNGGEARKSKAYPLLAAAAAGLVGLGNPLRSAAGRPSWWGGGRLSVGSNVFYTLTVQSARLVDSRSLTVG